MSYALGNRRTRRELVFLDRGCEAERWREWVWRSQGSVEGLCTQVQSLGSTLQVTRTMEVAACIFWSTHPEVCGQRDEDSGQVAIVNQNGRREEVTETSEVKLPGLVRLAECPQRCPRPNPQTCYHYVTRQESIKAADGRLLVS